MDKAELYQVKLKPIKITKLSIYIYIYIDGFLLGDLYKKLSNLTHTNYQEMQNQDNTT
jgi:hypothetical protein